MDENVKQSTELKGLTTPKAIIVAGLLIAGGIYFGLNSGKVNLASNNNQPIAIVTTAPGNQVAADAGAVAGQQTLVQLSVDDDPVLGNANAEVVIIEFSDYECPYCQRSFLQTMPEVKTNYIDTGKVKYVFRDLPLPMHDPVATEKALAANCARDQGGDAVYFKYHDELFTAGPGAGDLAVIAKNLKLNATTFNQCLESEKHLAEIQSDIQDATLVGATGTPTFVVGKVTADGQVEGELVIGAVPYAALDATLAKYLN